MEQKNSRVHGYLRGTQISSTWPLDPGVPRLIHVPPRFGGIQMLTYMPYAIACMGHYGIMALSTDRELYL